MWYVYCEPYSLVFLPANELTTTLSQCKLTTFQQIVWENRLHDDVGNDCLVTNDAVDCLTAGTGPGINKAFYTHKFNKPGLRYEVAECIRTGWIVWIHGPFPPGDWNDVTIFRDGLKHLLRKGERVEADDGYKAEDPLLVKAPSGVRFMEDERWHAKRSKVRRRHETINQRIKVFKILTDRFRHDIEKHSMCFRACAVLTQLSFVHGTRRPFSVSNYDQRWANAERCPLPGEDDAAATDLV